MNIVYRKIPYFKVGDKYIHFTKYGGVNTGVINRIVSGLVINNKFNCTYTKYSIVNEIGVVIDIDGTDGKVYKIND